MNRLESLGAHLVERRMTRDDILAVGQREKRRLYCCTGPDLMKALLEWTKGEDVVFESFEY
ncbi:uncharacterized protein BCR38DRAFT_439854 [Pseudomassariella vexata]|uniref:Uncharacterized protein n=1 Tax=Pseudomassariella vexata TaxID=1141098 RepID=A0A1Y2DPY2_9PEZI|nr:uncharacterized protein BCR38DRAFT_439854 [Pseudomassariella vexata]ORY61310.1 hypothetical protein BCR38DRAFT_439854 [Pseudomassariella vexata]